RMDAIGKGMLGLTIQCAQCHNHKFDPLTQEEYYRIFAFLNNDYEPQRVVYTPQELMLRESLSRQMREIDARLQHEHADWAQQMAVWEEQAKQNQPDWAVLSPDDYSEPGGGAKLSLLKDNSMLCAGYAPTHCEYRVVAKSTATNITALRLETLLHPNLPCTGPGRSFKGTFALTEIKIEAAPIDAPDKKQEFKIASGTTDFEQAESPLEPNFDDKSGKKRIVGPLKFAFAGSNET